MATSLSSAAQIVNAALTHIGWKQRIGSLYDGSAAAQLALQVFGQERDDLLRDMNPGFAIRNLAMTLLKSAPPGGYIPGVTPWNPATNPPVGWLFEYLYPPDCIKVRVVKPTPLFFPNVDPQPNPFLISNDNNYNPAQRVILCNVANGLLAYTARITDPTTMDVGFVQALVERLGEKLAAGLTGLEAVQAETAAEQGEKSMAEVQLG